MENPAAYPSACWGGNSFCTKFSKKQPMGMLTKVHKCASILGAMRDETLPDSIHASYMEQLKKKVKELRKKKDWTQEDLAREIGVSLSTVQRWEKQGAKPTRLARRELQRLFQEVESNG